MTKFQMFKDILTARRCELSDRIEKIEDRLDEPKDPDVEERSVEREEDEVLEMQAKTATEEIHAIDRAFIRMENGTYGICLSCHEPISEARLKAVPYANVCRECMDHS